MKKRLGQVWVETVVYTLIALVIIGGALAFIKPKLEKIQDQAILEQTSDLMENFNSVLISAVQGGPANIRKIEISLKEGKIELDGASDKIVFSMESKYQYGEVGQNITSGNIISLTKKRGDVFDVFYTLNYSRYNLTYSGKDISGTITKSSNLQKIFIENKGKGSDGRIILDLRG